MQELRSILASTDYITLTHVKIPASDTVYGKLLSSAWVFSVGIQCTVHSELSPIPKTAPPHRHCWSLIGEKEEGISIGEAFPFSTTTTSSLQYPFGATHSNCTANSIDYTINRYLWNCLETPASCSSLEIPLLLETLQYRIVCCNMAMCADGIQLSSFITSRTERASKDNSGRIGPLKDIRLESNNNSIESSKQTSSDSKSRNGRLRISRRELL